VARVRAAVRLGGKGGKQSGERSRQRAGLPYCSNWRSYSGLRLVARTTALTSSGAVRLRQRTSEVAADTFVAMKQLLFLGACLVALNGNPVKAQTTTPDIVVVRLHEYDTSVHLAVTHGDGKTEHLKFDSGVTEKRLMASAEGYHRVLLKLYQDGYALQSTFSAAPTSAGTFTTLVFVKTPKP
jgi:hypothetical protein